MTRGEQLCALPGVATAENVANRAEQNVEAKGRRTTANEELVEPFPAGVAQPASTANLPEPCQSGAHREDFFGGGPVEFVEFRSRDWPRTDERHLAANHVDELWKLVERMTAAEARKSAGDARIMRCFDRLCFDVGAPHGAEFEHEQGPAEPSDSGVANQRRAAGDQQDGDRDGEDQR